MMNPAHLHLVLNHIPIIGTALSVFVLIVGILKKSDEVKKTGMLLMVVTALLTIPVYISGNSAEGKVEGNYEDVDEEYIEVHEDAALYSFIAIDVVGTIAIMLLILYRKPKALPQAFVYLMLVLMLIVNGMMGYTATMGGRIHHPEIREDRLPWETKVGDADEKKKEDSKKGKEDDD